MTQQQPQQQTPPPDDVDKLKTSPEYRNLRKLYADQEWRLDNLYEIVDETGQKIPFRRNEAQVDYWRNRHSRDAIVKARKIGFSTMIEIGIADYCTFRGNITAGIVDRSVEDAETKLDIVRTAYMALPEELRNANKLVKNNDGELSWENGSSVMASTGFRGNTPQIVHVSEYGGISIDKPDQAREIQTGTLQAIPATGWGVVESTPKGRAGRFYEMIEKAKKAKEIGQALSALDYRLHFYGWWMKREYRLPSNLIIVPHELREYFGAVGAILKSRHGITLDADQQAWYAQKRSELGEDDAFEEFPSIQEETFFNSIKGAFWKTEISKARKDGRIGHQIDFDPSRRVETWWDIGEDCTAIIFVQTDGVRFRVIDYNEEEGGSIQSAATFLDAKRRERGFQYSRHIGPHDIDHREWGNNAQTRYKTALDLGIKFEVVPQIAVKEDSIDAARRLWNSTWVDEVHAGPFVERVENYRKKWNKSLQVYSAEPVHDMSSHPADAYQQGAVYHTSSLAKYGDQPRDRSRPPKDRQRGSPWSR